jgi:hypothetical protein
MDRETNLGVRCKRWRFRSAPGDSRADDCESNEEERCPDHEVRPSGWPDQERRGEHVPNQPHAREITLSPELVLEVEQFMAVPIAHPSWI